MHEHLESMIKQLREMLDKLEKRVEEYKKEESK